MQVPGFRKGKVPPRIIDQRFGRGMVLQEAVNDALPGSTPQAVTETKVRPLGQPQVEVTDVPDPKGGGELKFTVEVDVRPDLELPDYASLEVTVDDVEVTDDDVDERLEELRERFGSLTGVERAGRRGRLRLDGPSAQIGGEEIDSVTGVSFEIGSKNMLEGLDEALVGLSAGETTTFASPLAGGDHAGEEAEVTVTVQSVKVRDLPALDDDFAQLASEFDTLEELRADLREQAATAKRFYQGVQARDRVLDALLERVEVPVPDSLVEAEVHQHLEGEDRLADDEHRAEVEEEARKAFRAQLLLDAVVEKENVQVGQQELIEYLVSSAQRYGMEPNAFAAAVDEQNQIPAMVAEVARRKALGRRPGAGQSSRTPPAPCSTWRSWWAATPARDEGDAGEGELVVDETEATSPSRPVRRRAGERRRGAAGDEPVQSDVVAERAAAGDRRGTADAEPMSEDVDAADTDAGAATGEAQDARA